MFCNGTRLKLAVTLLARNVENSYLNVFRSHGKERHEFEKVKVYLVGSGDHRPTLLRKTLATSIYSF